MIRLAQALHINQWALGAVKAPLSKQKLLAIVTLGNLGEEKAAETLMKLGERHNYLLALTALRALMKINPQKYVDYFMKLLINRQDWPLPQVVVTLKEIGADIISKPLSSAILSAPDSMKPKLISLLDLVHTHESFLTIKQLLESTKNPEIISATLSILKDPKCVEFAKAHLRHAEWFVRIQAARAIGRLGQKTDVELLVPLLSDQNWWVRYRSAEAIARLPFTTVDQLEKIRETQSDPFARDIVTQIIAEDICR